MFVSPSAGESGRAGGWFCVLVTAALDNARRRRRRRRPHSNGP